MVLWWCLQAMHFKINREHGAVNARVMDCPYSLELMLTKAWQMPAPAPRRELMTDELIDATGVFNTFTAHDQPPAKRHKGASSGGGCAASGSGVDVVAGSSSTSSSSSS